MNIDEAKTYAAQNTLNRNFAPGRLSGKITVVTGGAQGFGAGIAEYLYNEGASVLIADLPFQKDTAEKLINDKLGDRAAFCPCDVSEEESVKNAVCFCVEKFGGLDLFISNAGIAKAGDISTLDTEVFERIAKINYKGFYLCAKYASIIMKAQNEANGEFWGDIVQINSKSGIVGSKANFAYSSSKFAGIGLTQSLALELAQYRIKVNAVCPGNYYDGPLWSDPEKGLFVQYLNAGKVPGAKTVDDVKAFYLAKQPINNRGCLPSDVAKAVIYCVEQQFETGQAVPVTGGQVMLA